MAEKKEVCFEIPADRFILNDTGLADQADALTLPETGKLTIIVDQVLPPNSPAVSERHRKLMALAERTGAEFYYGDAMTAVLLARGMAKGEDIVVGTGRDVMAAGVYGAAGIRLDDESFAEAMKTGCIKLPLQAVDTVLLKGHPAKTTDVKRAALALVKLLQGGQLENTVLRLVCEEKDALSEEDKLQLLLAAAQLNITSAYFAEEAEELDAIQAGPLSKLHLLPFNMDSVSYTLDLAETEALAVLPGSYEKILPLTEIPKTAVISTFIGGSAGGAIRELRVLARKLKGRRIAYGTRLIVSPASREDYIAAANEGILTTVFEAGGLVINHCGNPAVSGRIGENEVMVSNDTENGIGFAGFASSRTFITDTETAAATALSGYIGAGEEAGSSTETGAEDISLEGRIWKFGDDIDTDIIIPTQHLNYATMDEIKTHAFEPLRPEIAAQFREGDLIVAGNNFGCGSSREQAAEVLLANGIHCVVAKSFARIFFRNAINNGVLLLECPALPDETEEGDVIRVDLSRQTITANGKQYPINQVPENLYRIIADGGLVKSVEKQFRTAEGGK